MGGLGKRCIRLVFMAMIAVPSILAACGGQEPTTTSTATVIPSATELPVTSIPSPTFSPTLAPTFVSTPTIPPSSTPTPAAQNVGLTLEVTTPAEDTVVASEFVTVAGLTSPDATVSVNGILALPDSQGRFSVDLPLYLADNPLPIEVIATSISGEQSFLVRTVIFVR